MSKHSSLTAVNNIDIKQCYGLTDEHIVYISQHVGIHKQMLGAFNALKAAARCDGFDLQIVSGFRDFERQLAIFSAKLSGQRPVKNRQNQLVALNELAPLAQIKAIMLFSALPGASRHHWGTDIDVYDANLQGDLPLQLEPWEYQGNGPQAPLGQWLTEHMTEFGFYRPYLTYCDGVAEEPWHISYAPLATRYMQNFNPLELHHLLTQSTLASYPDLLHHLDDLCQQFVFNVAAPERCALTASLQEGRHG